MYDVAENVLLAKKNNNDYHSPPRVCSDAADKRAEARFLRQLVKECSPSQHVILPEIAVL